MIIKYGTNDKNIDITEICFTKLNNNGIITIPSNDDNRAGLFGDPIYGTLKKIFITNNGLTDLYDDKCTIKIDVNDNSTTIINEREFMNKLQNIHSKLQIKYGSFNEEFPEQKLTIMYLNGNEKVLEIGGNIGRNSLVIASILNDSKNLVTLESDNDIANQLNENKILNKLDFHIVNSALSKRKLIQHGWDTIPSDVLIDGYKWVNTITFDDLKLKYNIEFDTLVLDCEGAFYYILIDMPEILDNIKLIIMENDYYDLYKKQYVDEILLKNHFYRDYVQCGGWGVCRNNFFEVWKKGFTSLNI
jgi:FkbM family methyltransferase